MERRKVSPGFAMLYPFTPCGRASQPRNRPQGGLRPAAVFYPFGHHTPYAYDYFSVFHFGVARFRHSDAATNVCAPRQRKTPKGGGHSTSLSQVKEFLSTNGEINELGNQNNGNRRNNHRQQLLSEMCHVYNQNW
jgi:hypothetical protein